MGNEVRFAFSPDYSDLQMSDVRGCDHMIWCWNGQKKNHT
jgi:hypothetical protein